MRYRKLAMLLALLLLFGAAAAEPVEVTASCRYKASVNNEHALRVTTDDYNTGWNGTGGKLTVTLPKGKRGCGIQLSFFREAVPVTVEALDDKGAVTGTARYGDRFLNTYIPLRTKRAYRISAVDAHAELRLNRVRVFSGKGRPAEAQTWHEPESPVDLLQIVTHPDDDLIWFGGLLPLYAGERKMNVLVAYAATRGSLQAGRFNELLDGLWTCGVKAYPVLGPFADFQVNSVQAVVSRWGKARRKAGAQGSSAGIGPKWW